MENFLVKLNSFLWGAPVLILLFAVGLLYAVKTRFFQFRHLNVVVTLVEHNIHVLAFPQYKYV